MIGTILFKYNAKTIKNNMLIVNNIAM